MQNPGEKLQIFKGTYFLVFFLRLKYEKQTLPQTKKEKKTFLRKLQIDWLKAINCFRKTHHLLVV